MLSFEQAGALLDGYAEELPAALFRELNGGVNLLRRAVWNEDGRMVMGTYNCGIMGRHIEIYYGSLAALTGEDDAEFALELKKTLHHELRHHLEDMAGDRSLERWDEEQKWLWRSSRMDRGEKPRSGFSKSLFRFLFLQKKEQKKKKEKEKGRKEEESGG